VLARENKMRMSMLIGTAILFIISGLITRFANMPINAIVRGWNSATPPDNWTALRDAGSCSVPWPMINKEISVGFGARGKGNLEMTAVARSRINSVIRLSVPTGLQ